jgi:hypothetical protein
MRGVFLAAEINYTKKVFQIILRRKGDVLSSQNNNEISDS